MTTKQNQTAPAAEVKAEKPLSLRQQFRAEFFAQLPTLATVSARQFRNSVCTAMVKRGMAQQSTSVEYNETLKLAIAEGKVEKTARGVLNLPGKAPVLVPKKERPVKAPKVAKAKAPAADKAATPAETSGRWILVDKATNSQVGVAFESKDAAAAAKAEGQVVRKAATV